MAEAAVKKIFHQPDYEQLSSVLQAVRYMGVERDLDRLLPYVAEHCVRAIEADRCSIFLVDPETNEVWSKLVQGEKSEIRFPVGTGIAGECIASGQPIVIEDPYSHPTFNRAIDQATGYVTKNLLCVPMTNLDDKVIGCFQVVNKKEGSFTEADQSLLSAFGAQAAVAIESALLHREKEEMIRNLTAKEKELRAAVVQLGAAYEIEQYASQSSGDMSSLAETSLSKILEAIDGEICALALSQADGLIHFYGKDRTGRQVHIAKETPDEEAIDVLRRQVIDSFGTEIQTTLEKALILSHSEEPFEGGESRRKKERIGWVCVINHQAGAFTERDDQLLDMIASKISSVCNRLSLMQQKRAADRLGIVGQLVSSVVHDIRNPMSTISGFSQLITASPDMDHDELTGFFRIIDSEILRCNNMLDELLDFAAGKSNLKLRKVQLQEFLDSINLSLSHQAERKGIGFEIYCEKDGDILMDPDRVMRVVFNIANNAFEVLGRGGSFRVDCSWQPDGLVEGHDDLH